jgi:hypothetical protein
MFRQVETGSPINMRPVRRNSNCRFPAAFTAH